MAQIEADPQVFSATNYPGSVKVFLKRAGAAHEIQPVGYTRFSTKMQKTTSTSRQVSKIIKYSDDKGWCRPIIFSDEAVSGTKISREQFDAMFDHCRRNPSTPIIVENMSRISRDGGAYQEFFSRRRETKAVTHVVGLGEMDDLREGIFQTLAAYEYRNLLEVMRDGRSQAAAAGKAVRRLGYGVIADELGYIDFDPITGPIIVKMFQLAAGGMRFANIARYLTAAGVPGPASDREWDGTFIGLVIKSPIYAGRVLHRPGALAWEQPPVDVPNLSDFNAFNFAEGDLA
ncbi:DNA invertase Pin-like site-specific DNA recombinase [Devosia sp. UYZn731]|uniref:recombinase family protein n=1 Tax=Devosia sp. UYZn731 TaxID=3156345 RepID=UPI0033994737